jgi:hypothetical protein
VQKKSSEDVRCLWTGACRRQYCSTLGAHARDAKLEQVPQKLNDKYGNGRSQDHQNRVESRGVPLQELTDKTTFHADSNCRSVFLEVLSGTRTANSRFKT